MKSTPVQWFLCLAGLALAFYAKYGEPQNYGEFFRRVPYKPLTAGLCLYGLYHFGRAYKKFLRRR